MKKINKNKFEANTKSFSLTKINPYLTNKSNYLPYRYSDPSFKKTYKGPLMQKDLYLLNLMNNRFNVSSDKYTFKIKKDLPLISSNPIEISTIKDIVFDSKQYYKSIRYDEFTKHSFAALKKKFFYINPVFLKKQLINYRKCKFKGIPTYRDKLKSKPQNFVINFQKQVNENNCLNWEKIKKKHFENELKKGHEIDKYYDSNKIYEVLGLKKPILTEEYQESKINNKFIKMPSSKNKLEIMEDYPMNKPNKIKFSLTSHY